MKDLDYGNGRKRNGHHSPDGAPALNRTEMVRIEKESNRRRKP